MSLYSNYQELVNSVVDWMDRSDIDKHMPEFVRSVTAEATRTLRVSAMEDRRILPILSNGNVTIPEDMLEAINLTYLAGAEKGKSGYVTRIPLHRSSKFQRDESFTENRERHSTPTSFCSNGIFFQVYPLPTSEIFCYGGLQQPAKEDVIGYVELSYYRLPEVMKEATDTNWLLCAAPDVYFYGCMMHACRFVRDMEMAQYWESKFTEAVAEVQRWSDKADQAGGAWMIGG